MSPQGSDIDIPSKKILRQLSLNDAVLERIESWLVSLTGRDDPMMDLAREVFETLQRDIISLKRVIVRAYLVDSNAAAMGIYLPDNQLSSIRAGILQMLQILELVQHVERSGQGGAINALFAKEYFVNDNNHDPGRRSFDNHDKLDRIVVERNILVGNIMERMLSDDPSEAIQRLGPRITEFLSRVARQFRPRYVHVYDHPDDVPYNVDNQSQLFHGSACIVRKVTHARTGVAFAMKTLSGLVSHAQTSQILQEIALLEVCSHKNIVCLFEAFGTADEDHTVNLVLSPWAPYRLFDFVSKNDANRRQRCPWLVPGCPASDRCVFRIMYEISDAIRYLHEKGIKHKDLKPDNILLYNEWGADTVTPLITDVGVSKVPISGMKTNPDQTMYSYRAPEQDRRDLSTLHSDIWQLGCCLAELLAAARGGTAGWMCLFHSWNNDREDCSCVIAKERGPFMDALGSICLPGSEAQEIAHRVVTGMMDLCPSGRLDISMVTATFAQLTLE